MYKLSQYKYIYKLTEYSQQVPNHNPLCKQKSSLFQLQFNKDKCNVNNI